MLFLSIFLSVGFIFMCKMFPKCMVYSMIIGTLLVYIGLIIFGIVIESYAISAVFGIMLIINLIILWCYWSRIQIAIVLLEVSGIFIFEKPAVYGISGLVTFMSLIYLIFWVAALLAASGESSAATTENEQTQWTVIIAVWWVIYIFFAYFLYYCLVYLIASAAAYWYYQNPEKGILVGFGNMRYSIGSMTFGSIIITIITVMRILAGAES